MKHKSFYIFLCFEAISCVILNLAEKFIPHIFTGLIAFPFAQIGSLLRILSLSGSIGNFAAIVIYAAICLVPVIIMFLLKKKHRLYMEDALLAILSIVLFVVIYYMINPGFLGDFLGRFLGYSAGKELLGASVYSVIAGYILIRVMRLFFSADVGKLQKYLIIMLNIINIFIVLNIFGFRFGNLMDSFNSLRAGSTGNEHRLGLSYFFLVLKYIVDSISNAMIIPVFTSVQNLLHELAADRYSEQTAACAEKLSSTCRLAIVLSILSNLGYNILQLGFINKLSSTNTTIQAPVVLIAFLLAALIFAQYIRESRRLKEDNDMII